MWGAVRIVGLISRARTVGRRYSAKFFLEFGDLLVTQIFQVHEAVSRAFNGMNQFVELEMNSFSVAILGVLDQKHHEECNNRRARIDYQLPSIGEMKERARQSPDNDEADGNEESAGASDKFRDFS
jgi:hypothetical protein